jgi:alcohol dehydrogenase
LINNLTQLFELLHNSLIYSAIIFLFLLEQYVNTVAFLRSLPYLTAGYSTRNLICLMPATIDFPKQKKNDPESKSNTSVLMKALVYHGAGKKAWEEKPKPTLVEPSDAIIKISKTTICGTDLHILKGDVPEVIDGRILGHEGVGIVEEVGSAVTEFKKGDRVLISCITSCGKCDYCKRGMYSHCEKGGWILGHLIDGTQAEYVRIPFADNSLYHVPKDADEEALVMLSDILPTAYECGVLNGQVKPGDTVVIVGAGPIGLAVLITAQFYTPAAIIMVDVDDYRLKVAQTLGATHVINSNNENGSEKIMQLTKTVAPMWRLKR